MRKLKSNNVSWIVFTTLYSIRHLNWLLGGKMLSTSKVWCHSKSAYRHDNDVPFLFRSTNILGSIITAFQDFSKTLYIFFKIWLYTTFFSFSPPSLPLPFLPSHNMSVELNQEINRSNFSSLSYVQQRRQPGKPLSRKGRWFSKVLGLRANSGDRKRGFQEWKSQKFSYAGSQILARQNMHQPWQKGP